MRGVLEAVTSAVHPGATLISETDTWVVRRGEAVIGRALELQADRPAWAGRLFGFELALPAGLPEHQVRYRPVPAWPAVERDVALVLGAGRSAVEVEQTLREAAGKLLERLWVFDEYRGRPLAEGERSVAWRLVFRASDRTLREEEAERALAGAVAAAERRHGVRRREA
jgi:phenylalanyl-tRNA synthetase beta subunit